MSTVHPHSETELEVNPMSTASSKSPFLVRNSGLMLGVGVFVTGWMLVYTFVAYKPTFASKSVVIIKDSAVNARYVEPDQYYALPTTSSSSSNPVLNTMGILKSSAISDALWQYFQTQHPEVLKKDKLTSRKKWDAFFQDGSAFIKAKNQAGTDLISVQFAWENPVIAKEGLGTVLNAFQNASRDLNRAEQRTRIRFLDKQVAEIETQLSDVRQTKSSYQSDKKTVSVKRESEDLAGTRMELENKLNQLEALARGKERLVARYQQLVGLTPEQAVEAAARGQNQTMEQLQGELYRLQQQYADVSTTLTDNNPKVKELQAQIRQVQANIEAEMGRTMVGSHRTDRNKGMLAGGAVADGTRGELIKEMLAANGEAQDIRAQAATIRTRLGQVQSEISAFPEKAEGLSNIEQKEASLSIALDHLRQKALEARIKEEQTLSNVFIVDPPRLPEKPQFPAQNHLIFISLFMGAVAGVSVAFAKEQLTRSAQHSTLDVYPHPGVSQVHSGWFAPIEGSDVTEAESLSISPVTTLGAPAVSSQTRVETHSTQAVDTLSASTEETEPVSAPAPAVEPNNLAPWWVESTQSEQQEKVELPSEGSLFDTLVPLAGPMAQPQQVSQFSEPSNLNRPDLTGPISPMRESQPVVAESMEVPDIEPQALQPAQWAPPSMYVPDTEPQTEHETSNALQTPVESVVTQTQTYYQEQEPISWRTPQVIQVEAEALALPEQPLVVTEQALADQSLEDAFMQEGSTTALNTPSRKLRSIPKFLLADRPGAIPQDFDVKHPYTLIPKKQLLNPQEDLLQEVAPMSAPSDMAQISEGIPFPDFDADPGFRPRKPLLKPLRFGKKPEQNAEAYFGMGRKRNEFVGQNNRHR